MSKYPPRRRLAEWLDEALEDVRFMTLDDPAKTSLTYAKNLTRSKTKALQRSGEVRRGPCEECGSEDSENHHPNYQDPMLIRRLCQRCHKREHDLVRAGKLPPIIQPIILHKPADREIWGAVRTLWRKPFATSRSVARLLSVSEGLIDAVVNGRPIHLDDLASVRKRLTEHGSTCNVNGKTMSKDANAGT